MSNRLPPNAPPPNGQPVIPANFRRFKFRFNFQSSADGRMSGGEGETYALEYTGALVKILALFQDQPGRIVAFEFRDVTDEVIIARG